MILLKTFLNTICEGLLERESHVLYQKAAEVTLIIAQGSIRSNDQAPRWSSDTHLQLSKPRRSLLPRVHAFTVRYSLHNPREDLDPPVGLRNYY